jgi:hypothetical protein
MLLVPGDIGPVWSRGGTGQSPSSGSTKKGTGAARRLSRPVSTIMMSINLRSLAAATAISVAFCATATAVRAQDSASLYSVRDAIGRGVAPLAEASGRRTTWQQPSPPARTWVDRHRVAAGAGFRAAAATTSQQEAVQGERSWVGRHPALTGALIGAGVGATYAYIMCRGACEGQPGLYMTLFGGIGSGIGAGIGAGTGAIVSALRH